MNMLPATLVNISETLRPIVSAEILKGDSVILEEFSTFQTFFASASKVATEKSIVVAGIDHAAQLNELASGVSRHGNPPCLAILSFDPTAKDLQSAMRAGVNQVITPPFQPSEFREIYDLLNFRSRQSEGLGKLVLIAGAHGGVGASSFAVNVAYESAEHFKKRTILVECSNSCGVVLSYLDRDARRNIEDLMQLKDSFDIFAVKNSLLHYSQHLSILPGNSHVTTSTTHGKNGIFTYLLDCLQQMAEVVIADISTDALSENEQLTLQNEQKLVLVCDHSIPSLQIAKKCVNDLFAGKLAMLVINRYDDQLECIQKSKLSACVGVKDIRTISNNHRIFTNAINQGQPLRFVAPNSQSYKEIVDITAEILDIAKNPNINQTNTKTRFSFLKDTVNRMLFCPT